MKRGLKRFSESYGLKVYSLYLDALSANVQPPIYEYKIHNHYPTIMPFSKKIKNNSYMQHLSTTFSKLMGM